MDKKFDRLDWLLDRFKQEGIIQDSKKDSFNYVLEFQDIIGRSSYEEIYQWYLPKEQPTRRIFIWACSCCLAIDLVQEILKQVVCKDIISEAEIYYEKSYYDKLKVIEDREADVIAIKTDNLYLKQRIFDLEENIKHLVALNASEKEKFSQAQLSAKKYLQIKDLLK